MIVSAVPTIPSGSCIPRRCNPDPSRKAENALYSSPSLEIGPIELSSVSTGREDAAELSW